jgi:hypothetical protein
MAQYVSIQEASSLVGISVTGLRRGVKAGRFPAIRVGGTPKGKLLFDLQELAQVLADEAYMGMQTGSRKDGE